jgi:hypothetical protein
VLSSSNFAQHMEVCVLLFRVFHRSEKKFGDELEKKDTEIPLSVHWVYLYEFEMHI